MNTAPQLSIRTALNQQDLYSDSRDHGYQGNTRNARLPRVTPHGGGAIAKSEDGTRCAVTGKESLRIVRVSESTQHSGTEHKFSVGRGGHRIDASRNFWDSSGLKIDSASTDIAWCHGPWNNKILTSARNGEVIMWDLAKSGPTKLERRTKDHIRSINKISVSQVIHHYCITGSADGHMRVWDLRDMSKSIMRVHHPTSVRSLVFSPSPWQPLQAVVGLDSGSVYRWDLRVGQRGLLDRLPVAHTAPVTALDWCCPGANPSQGPVAVNPAAQSDSSAGGVGWLVTGSLDRSVKVWDITSNTHIPHKPTYTLHPSFPVRRVSWRPGYECEVAIVAFSASTSEASQASPAPPPSGLITRVGSSLGLDNLRRNVLGPENLYMLKEKLNAPIQQEAKSSDAADVVEIWDVRRPWIAKWSVSDIAFNDSHALWALNHTGSFSQLDLRDATKPLDAIPRVSLSWEATGTLTFVTDREERWEVPYDDIVHEQRHPTQIGKNKALGNAPYIVKKQTMGTFVHELATMDFEVLAALSRRYIVEGKDREAICAYNAGVALSAGQDTAAQIWLLLGASLAPSRPPAPPPLIPSSSKSRKPPTTLPQPPPTASSYTFPQTKPSDASSTYLRKVSPVRRATTELNGRLASNPRKLTPNSSANSSPLHNPLSLPPIVTPRRNSIFTRRESVDSNLQKGPSLLRRASLSVGLAGHSASPTDRGTSKHMKGVGDGVLDSDSSSEDEREDGNDTAGPGSSDEEPRLSPLLSPGLNLPRTTPTPSPLSQVADPRVWSDADDHGRDSDDEDSPSPQSTDTDSHASASPAYRTRPSKSLRRNSDRVKSRSRSSTLASLAAPPPRNLLHQDSQSSIRTVTGQDAGYSKLDSDDPWGATTDYNINNNNNNSTTPSTPYDTHRPVVHYRQKSQAASEMTGTGGNGYNNRTSAHLNERSVVEVEKGDVSSRRVELVREEERWFRESTLAVLRDTLEELADEGDVQMCAMLAIIAPTELRLSTLKAMRYIDAYIEILERLKLFVCAAYLRKFCKVDDVRKKTMMETVIYTACGKCRKPIVLSGPHPGWKLTRGAFSFCTNCKNSTAKCSICRLPVRTLLFQCSICHHGGHQTCYRQFYLQTPMVDLPSGLNPSSPPPFIFGDERGRTSLRTHPHHQPSASTTSINTSASIDDDASSLMSTQSSMVDPLETSGSMMGQSPTRRVKKRITGHPCAAGCGHFCWAANQEMDTM